MSHKLSIFHWNCFNMTSNRAIELAIFLIDFSPSVVLLNEIKLCSENANLLLRFSNYFTYHKCRNEAGGGVAILVREDAPLSEISINFELEGIGLSIQTEKYEFNIITYYNPPSTELSHSFISHFSALGPLMIAGDLNSKCKSIGCKSTNQNGKILEQLLEESSLLLINDNSPTYRKFNSEYSEILDLFLCSDNLSSKIENFEVLYDYSMGSDHYLILVKLSFEKTNSYQSLTQKNRSNQTLQKPTGTNSKGLSRTRPPTLCLINQS